MTKITVLVMGMLLFVAGCGRTGNAQNATSKDRETAAQIVPVATTMAIERAVPIVIRATGTFVADESSDVSPQVAGQVIETPVNVGDHIAGGQVVVRLDDRDARLRLAQAEAALQQAEAQAQNIESEAKRASELFENGILARNEYERSTTQLATSQAAVAQARAQVDVAKKAVEDCIIRAPFSGDISSRPVAVGEYVTPAMKVVTIVRIQPIRLELQVPESDAAKVRIGMGIDVTVAGYPNENFSGTVSARNVAIDPNSRAMTVEAKFANANSRLTPGMFGNAEVRLPNTEHAVLVPSTAVVQIANGESAGVYVIDGGKARIRVVQAGEEQNGMTRILSGLEAGSMVAVSNVNQLFDGAPVQSTTAAAASSAADTY
jgi:RND family efflux transporter MFP subunit